MTLRKKLAVAALVILGLLALLYVNRIHLFKYSLGWYTDFKYPRDPNRPVPWTAGPEKASLLPAQRPPNIIIILADDLGINDVSTHGGGHTAEGVPTPHIDSIARDGVRFEERVKIANGHGSEIRLIRGRWRLPAAPVSSGR